MIEPHYKTKEEAPITVMLDTRATHEPKLFRCSVCGNIVFEYTNPLHVIVAGKAETKLTPTVVQCPHSVRVPKDGGDFVFIKCKTRYYIIK